MEVGSRGLGSWISTAGGLRLAALDNYLTAARFPTRFNFTDRDIGGRQKQMDRSWWAA
jgi:hypothetical protein